MLSPGLAGLRACWSGGVPRACRRLANVGLVFLFAVSTALAYDFSVLKPQGHVSDFAGVIDAARRTEIERYCALVRKNAGAEIAIAIIPTLHGEPVEDVANVIFRAWGVGAKDSNKGVLLLLAVRDRKSRLEVGYGLEPVIPDGYAGSVLREMRPALRAGHYGDAVTAAVSAIGGRIAQAGNIRLDPAALPRPSRSHPEPVPWVMLIGGAALLFLALFMGIGRRRRLRRRLGYGRGWIFPWGWAGAGYAARSGGGFGGYDSSDHFGGFGGGDSGGGGASSNW